MTVLNISELMKIIEKHRKEGKKIVTTNGCFDILHVGHIHSFETAKKQGDILIVGVNSDRSVKAYKGPSRPVNSQHERAKMVASLKPVDYVIIFDEDTPNELLDKIKTDVHVKSKTGYTGVEEKTVIKHGGRVFLVEDIPNKSTTNIINKMKK